ncbi:NADH-quinone oxidoreductase subunit N [Chloroflexales bacterium ZM16-3]|nr:NADH-quinone oxidoreductase subunit N [Chloroflexales bacterium ZM16-3]
MQPIDMPAVNLSLLAPMLIIFGWAAVLLLVDVFAIPEGNKKLTGYLAIIGMAVAGLAGLPLWGASEQGLSTFGGMLMLDRYALTLTWIFLMVGALSVLMSLGYLQRQGIEQGEFYPLVLFAVGAMILLAQGANLIVIFLGIELLSLTLYILTGFAYPRVTSEEAAMKYLVLGAFAAGFFVYGIALIYGATGTLSLAGIAAYLGRQTLVAVDQTLLLAGSGLVLVALGFKVALVPFHMWTPDVYEGSPTPVAAFMSVGTKGAALAALLRILTQALPSLQPIWLPLLATLAALTMLLGSLGAIAQRNMKRMLAYSSISHAGYLLLGVIVASTQTRGTEAFLFYLLSYALTNLGAFAVLVALEQHGELAWSLDSYAGLGRRKPLLAVAMAVFMFSLAGVPPTAGFMGKLYVFSAAWSGGLGWLALIGVISSAASAFFYLRLISRMFMQESPEGVPTTEVSRGVGVDIWVAVAATLLIGLVPAPFITLIERSLVAAGS